MTSKRDFYSEYEWLKPLAEGGMGTVYECEDKRNNRKRCVIKQMRSDDARSPEELEEAKRLFRREVAILRGLDHTNIVPFIDDYVSDDGRYFLVMDFIEGNNLETVIHNEGPFSQDDAIMVGIQICEVLEYLHDRSIIYRDLKPSNLMLTPEGHIILIDFGIARILMPSTTATRVVTAGYSPPEQYFGKPEPRSDLYALGATLAHLVTGVRPRPLIPSVPRQQGADVLPSFDLLISRLTAHNPAERPISARVVLHTLFRVYKELHPECEIPDFDHEPLESREDQFISQKIMRTGLTAASSAKKDLPRKKGPEFESYSDEEMPSSIAKIFFDTLKQSSGKMSRYEGGDDDEESRNRSPVEGVTKGLRDTLDKLNAQSSIWQKLIKWVSGRG